RALDLGRSLGSSLYTTIHDNTAVDCRYTSTHMISSRISDQPMTLLNSVPSSPSNPTAATPIARFCGEIIFPSTPPDEFAAAISTGSRSAFFAAATWRAPNSEFEDVSDPVTATPIQPSRPERNANTPPAPASHWPI